MKIETFTYIGYDGSSDYIKVGKTSKIEHRLQSYRTSCPEYQFIFLIPEDIEDYLFSAFDFYRMPDTECLIINENLYSLLEEISLTSDQIEMLFDKVKDLIKSLVDRYKKLGIHKYNGLDLLEDRIFKLLIEGNSQRYISELLDVSRGFVYSQIRGYITQNIRYFSDII